MSSETEDQSVQKILAETIERREAGESISDADVIAACPEHAEKLQGKLEQLQVIARAQQLADDASTEETFSPEESRKLTHCPSCESRWKLSSGLAMCPTCGMELNTVSEDGPHPGQQIRHYILVEQIGSGGFGTVWRARDSKLECDVAIKIPRNEWLSTDEVERFIREARVSAQLRKHPNIVSVHEADWEDEIAYISSDFIEGASLGDRMEQYTLPQETTVHLMMAICDALHHAHEEGIVHRDLKPDNILLDSKDVPHVTDFGLARQESQAIASEVGQIMGTAAYMSPEQAKGASEQADRRSDVFSLGVVLYEMLTGERPFRGSVPRTLRQILDADPPLLREFNSRIPLDLETICLKCLEKDPNLRYQTMKELKADLQRFQKHKPILARPISTAGQLWRWCKRNPVIPWLSLALFLVTFGAMVTAGILLNRRVAENQDEVVQVMQNTFKEIAFQASENAELTLEEGFEAVKEMSEHSSIIEALKTWEGNENKDKFRDELYEEAEQKQDDPEKLEFPDPIAPVQESLLSAFKTIDSNLTTFSWFVCDVGSCQIARTPKKKTLGTDFFYRSYFTGGKEYAKATPRSQVDGPFPNWIGPRLSGAFVTDTGDACVIAVSAPVWDENEGAKEKELLGVVGIFIELGKLVEVAANDDGQDYGAVNMAIYDGRNENVQNRSLKNALLIHHPQLHAYLDEKLSPEIIKRGEIPVVDEVVPSANLEFDGDLKKQSNFVRLTNYHDPLADTGKAEQWLAVRSAKPLEVPNSKRDDELYVVIQMPMRFIKEPGTHLRANLIVLGLSVVCFSAAILIPMWIIILRRVIKE